MSGITGVGLSLKAQHYQVILNQQPPVPWFEVLADNYLLSGSGSRIHLERVRHHYPVTLHGVGMSLGSTDPLNWDYLDKLKALADQIQPQWISDHLCWNSVQGQYLNDLLPLPYTAEAMDHVAERIKQVQEFLGQKILIENVSTYLSFQSSEMSEAEFVRSVAEKADCLILLDVNNIYVSSYNSGSDPLHYLQIIPVERVREFHLAGYTDKGTHLLDTHSAPVHPPVWDLYQQAVRRFGPVPTLIEWDSDIPAFEVLQQQAVQAEQIILSEANLSYAA
jgi:hypothetical protein